MKCLELTGGRGELEKTIIRVMLSQTTTIVDVVISTTLVALPSIAFSLVGPVRPGPSTTIVIVGVIILWKR